MNRRVFIKHSFLGAAASLIPKGEILSGTTLFDTLAVLQEDLLPASKQFGINAPAYMALVLNHPHIQKADKRFIKNAITWLNEEAINVYQTEYAFLEKTKRTALLENIRTKKWGENFLSSILGFFLEALLGDPIYGINNHERGWQWLSHTSGLPRPKEPFL